MQNIAVWQANTHSTRNGEELETRPFLYSRTKNSKKFDLRSEASLEDRWRTSKTATARRRGLTSGALKLGLGPAPQGTGLFISGDGKSRSRACAQLPGTGQPAAQVFVSFHCQRGL